MNQQQQHSNEQTSRADSLIDCGAQLSGVEPSALLNPRTHSSDARGIDVHDAIAVEQKETAGGVVVERLHMGAQRSHGHVEIDRQLLQRGRSTTTNNVGDQVHLSVNLLLATQRRRFGGRSRRRLPAATFLLLCELSSLYLKWESDQQ